MEEKITKIIYVIAVLAAISIAIIYYIPSLKNVIGSSDTYVDVNKYETIVGVTVGSTGPEFLLVLNNEKVTNILFLNQQSIILYNKDIEKNNIESSVNKIINILEHKSYLSSKEVSLTKYQDDKDYEKIKNAFSKNLIVTENTSSYQEKAQSLELEVTEDSKNEIRILEAYSYSIISDYKNDRIDEGISNRMTKEEAIKAANRVYEKLMTYAIDVENQDVNSNALSIEKIPANADLTIYPSEESWYYIKNHKVYAYINFIGLTDDYEFCYNGSIENMKEGECS